MDKKTRLNTKLLFFTPEAKEVNELNGTLLYFSFNTKAAQGENGGCGSPTYVEGTNGGQMNCGSNLRVFGVNAPYYCGACDSFLKNT